MTLTDADLETFDTGGEDKTSDVAALSEEVTVCENPVDTTEIAQTDQSEKVTEESAPSESLNPAPAKKVKVLPVVPARKSSSRHLRNPRNVPRFS